MSVARVIAVVLNFHCRRPKAKKPSTCREKATSSGGDTTDLNNLGKQTPQLYYVYRVYLLTLRSVYLMHF